MLLRTTLPVRLLAALLALAPVLGGQQVNEGPRRRAMAVIDLVLENGDASAFLEAHASRALRERVGEEVLRERLGELLGQLRGADLDDVVPEGPFSACLVFVTPEGRGRTVLMRIEEAAPHGITDLWFDGGFRLDPDAEVEPLPPPITWDGLAQRMEAEEAAGFAGALLVVRDGEVVVNEGYGMANREERIPCTPDTIFAIGSTPIDFTKAGILLLAQDGALDLDQPITDFFEKVPAEKRATTVRHLMTGGSGLQDFHDAPTDRDHDHAWIDREEAVRRILGQELLFAPGTGNQHSHSAWGLLAAILEIVSGSSYQDFTRELLFEPAGMKDTGFFGDPIPKERLAIGYGDRTDGETNAPPFWGETSWLVMGSGGMVSTTGDMLRWMQAIRSGKILRPEWQTLYWAPPGTLLAGGDMYGFEIVYTEGPGTQFVLISNAVDGSRRRPFLHLVRGLANLR